MEMPRAVFSTNLGQHPPRPLQPPLPSIIVRSNPELDKHVFGTALRQRWPPSCKLINHSFNISDYFDDMDVHVQGAEFLWHVLHHLACENAVRREGIAMFAMDWSRANSARFEALGKDTDMAGFFSAEEAEGFGEEWLSDVFSRLKEMRSEGRGIGALTRNAHRHIQATAGARPRIQHYASTQVKSPPHIQRISCTSPVYTPSMISSGSWSGQQTPMGPGLDGHQLMNPHGSPPLPIYGSAGPVDSHFNQISPTTGIWDMRGQLPPPRLPADLRQNAFGDHLRIHGSVATRRSRAPPHLRLDMGNASIDGFLRQDQAPLTPFTAASFAQNGYIHNTEPSVAFQSAGPMYPVYPMHNPQFQHTDMFLNHSVSGNAGLVNPQLTHPQPTKPNPVVNTRDPSYISGDARLPRQGFTSYDSHQSNATHRKSLVKQEVSRNEQKGQKRIEPGLPHLDISGEGSNNKIHQSQDTHRASQPNWSAHTSQADYQPLLNNFATPESRDNGRTPLIDNTNRSPYTNATQLSEPPNTNYNSSRGLPHRGIENHLSVFVTRYAPSTTREELCDIFSQFGLIANVFMKQEPYYAYINFREIGARNRALASMNGFILNGRPLLVEPKRQIRVSSDRNLRKFSGNSSGTPPEYQIGVASQETNPHAHKAPGGASGLFSQLHRDGKQMAGQYPPCIPVPTPKQSGARILDSLPGYEGSIRPMSPSPQNQHLQGPTAVDVSVRELTTHSRDSNNLAFHGPPTNNDTDYPPLNASIGPIHNGVDGVPPSKSPKKFKRAKGGKKQVGRRNARNEADNLRSSVHNAQVKKLVAEAIPFSHSSNASESGIIKPKSDGVNRRFSF